MKPRALSVALALLLTAAGTARAQEKPPAPAPSPSPALAPRPTFATQVEQVIVDVVVSDKKGNPIKGLTRDDIAVTEDGKPQAISSFEAVELPPGPAPKAPPPPRVSTNVSPLTHAGRTFVVVFDDIHLSPFQAVRAKVAVTEFLKTGVREGDQVMLIATGGAAWWSARMEAGRDELTALLKRLDGRLIPDISPERMSDYEAMRIHIYRDPQVGQRVRRRWDTFGANPGSTRSQSSLSTIEDPLVESRATEVYYQAVSRNRITLELLARALESLASVKGRKSMILVSEGFIYDPNLDEFKKVMQASRRSNVAVYFLDTRGLEGLPVYMTAQFGGPIDSQDVGAAFLENVEASEGAESIASDSGGFTVKNTNDLKGGLQRIANELQAYYLLGYSPTNTARDGKFRRIEVKVKGKGLQVRARKGYYAPLEGKAPEKKPQAVDPDIQVALDSPYEMEEIPLRMTAYVMEETIMGKAAVLVATDVDVRGFAFEEKEGRFVDSLEVLLVVAHRETGEYFRYDQKVEMKLLSETRTKLGQTWFSVVRNFELKAGGYQAKIVVRDKNSGRVGTVTHNFDVPDLSQFRVSSPMLSDTLTEGSGGTPHPALLVRRTFSPRSVLYCQLEVYGAAKDKTGMPQVSMGYSLRRADGTAVMQVPATVIRPTSIGKLSRLVGTPLEATTPGEYEMVLDLKDELAGKTLEVHEPFTVEAASGD